MKPMLLKITTSFMLCLFVIQITNAQILNKPVPADNPNLPGNSAWTAACASADFNEYYVNFTWSPPLVEASNEFILELSDATGDFNNATELSRTVDNNTTFDFDFRFELAQDVQGDNYRFRVRSTAPEVISEESDPFSMYYIGYNSPILISQNGNGTIPPSGTIQICDGGALTLATHNVPDPENYNYTWYRSGTVLSESSNQITVDTAGIYFVELDYGPICSGSANTISNSIEVTVGTSQGISINPPSQTTLCPTDIITLTASVTGMGYDYTWYKDGTVIAGPTLEGSSLNVDGGVVGFEGDYTVAIAGTGICQEESDPITLNSPGSFTVTRNNPERLVLLPGQTETLSISTNASNPTIQWFFNGNVISGETNTSLTITAIGEYYATVTETGGACGSSTKSSESTRVVAPESFAITISYRGNYATCENSSIQLEVLAITATENGNTVDVTSQLMDDFTFQWFLDGTAISNENNNTITIASAAFNGNYRVEGGIDSFTTNSNNLDVTLNSGDAIAIESNGAQLCDGVTITISTDYIIGDQPFNWLRNGQSVDTSSLQLVVTEPGIYQLSVQSNGCPILSNEITLEQFDESVITVDADEEIVFPEGESQTVTASGGDAYEWYDAQSNLISSLSSVTLELEGNYLLIARVDDCQVTKNFTVSYRDNFAIPNVITANGDGINDLWVIPNTYSRQEDVTVIIYNELGEELLNQNDYANNWPPSSLSFSKKNQLFYYKIRKNNQTLKQGTITVIR